MTGDNSGSERHRPAKAANPQPVLTANFYPSFDAWCSGWFPRQHAPGQGFMPFCPAP